MPQVLERPTQRVEVPLRVVEPLPERPTKWLRWMGWLAGLVAVGVFVWMNSVTSPDTPASVFAGFPEDFNGVNEVVFNDVDPLVLEGIEEHLGVAYWSGDATRPDLRVSRYYDGEFGQTRVTARKLDQDLDGNTMYEVMIRGETRGEVWTRDETVAWSAELHKVVPVKG